MNIKKINIRDYKFYVEHDNRLLYERRKRPPKIDGSLTKTNFVLYKDQNDKATFEKMIKLCDNKKKLRDNTVIFGSFIVQVNETIKPKDYGKFFAKSIQFIRERYGAVFNAYAHNDEINYKKHLHVIFPCWEKGTHKFNAKKIITRQDLKTLHTDFEKYMSAQLGYPISMLNNSSVKDSNGKAFSANDLQNNKKLIANNQRLQKELDDTRILLNKTLDELKQNAPVSYNNFTNALTNVVKNDYKSIFYRVRNWFARFTHIVDKPDEIITFK